MPLLFIFTVLYYVLYDLLLVLRLTYIQTTRSSLVAYKRIVYGCIWLATSWTTRVWLPVGDGISPFVTMFTQVLGSSQPPYQWMLKAVSQRVQWLQHETDQSVPYSAEVKNVWSTPWSPHIFTLWYQLRIDSLALYASFISNFEKTRSGIRFR
jgi:hypothetical protein